MAKTAGEMQRDVRELVVAVEALALHSGIQFPAPELLSELQALALRLEGYRPQQTPPDALEMEVAIARVRTRVSAEQDYIRWMQTRPVARMVGYQLLWLVAISLLVVSWWNHQQRWGVLVPREVEVLIGCMLWAATGACFSSILAMVRRRAERTLLPDYETWHFLKPLVGAFVGCLVYLILAGGVHFFSAPQAGVPATIYGAFSAVANRAFLAYLLSALMGFQERTFFAKIEVLIKVVLGLQPPAPAPTPAPSPAPSCLCHCCCECGGHRHSPPDPPVRRLPPDPEDPLPD